MQCNKGKILLNCSLIPKEFNIKKILMLNSYVKQKKIYINDIKIKFYL